MIPWSLILIREPIFFTEIMPRGKRISWNLFIYAGLPSHIKEAKIRRSSISGRMKHISG